MGELEESVRLGSSAKSERLVIETVSIESADLAKLIAKLDRYLDELYPAEEIFGVDFDDPNTGEMTFAVAYLDGIAVGCGGIRRLDAVSVELKRFYVEPEIRRQGIASNVLLYLEQCTAELGLKVMRLETGAPQVESVLFYKKHGFYEIERFGEYVNCASSLCMEKQITASDSEHSVLV